MLALSEPLGYCSASSLGYGAQCVLPDSMLQQQQMAGPHLQVRYRGLGYDRKFNCWRVRIFFNGKQRHVGRFRDTLTAARAYNKVVSFLYGDKAILNLVPDGDEFDSYDIPYSIRQAKLEAESAASSVTSTSSNTSLIAQPSGDLASGASNLSHSSMHHLQDTFVPQFGAPLLPLSTGFMLDDPSWLQLASESPLDSPVLAPDFPGSLGSTSLHPSTEFLQASTGLLQPMISCTSSMHMSLGTPSTSVLQEPSAVRCMASTQALLDASTQQLQLELNTLLRQQSAPINYHALGGLGTGFLQASTNPAVLPQAPMMAPLFQQPSMLPSLASAVPAAAGATSGNMLSTGVAMGYPVISQGLYEQRLAPGPVPVQHLGMGGLAAAAQPSSAVTSNGLVVMFAPAAPA